MRLGIMYVVCCYGRQKENHLIDYDIMRLEIHLSELPIPEKLEESNRLKDDERVPWLLKLHSSMDGAGPPSTCCIAQL
ncbi:hypothetical protein C5167_007988 [Papaver somniferum]|uniref:Uncharacterized protein n=1 Tax=Papaver somniferum TaxID=3469 RepID=A0A4Y7JUB8_PAPSO|nr:hypothetical protein C5167_007988 [Papaver somniferum]